MKEYGKLDLRNCDCMELMKEYPDNHFDLAITSPPYNMNLRVRDGKYCSRQVGVGELSDKYNNYSDNMPLDEYYQFSVNVISELIRISKLVFWNVQIVTGNKPAVYKYVGFFADHLKESIIWDKCNAEPSISNGCLNSEFEHIFVFAKGKEAITRSFSQAQYKRGARSNVWRIRKNKGSSMNHKAAYPIELPKTILRDFGKPGQKVIDPFLGTGTTAIACHYAGFDLTGSELDEDYYNAMMDRIERETAQQELF